MHTIPIDDLAVTDACACFPVDCRRWLILPPYWIFEVSSNASTTGPSHILANIVDYTALSFEDPTPNGQTDRLRSSSQS